MRGLDGLLGGTQLCFHGSGLSKCQAGKCEPGIGVGESRLARGGAWSLPLTLKTPHLRWQGLQCSYQNCIM